MVLAEPAHAQQIHRFALIVGSNDGGSDRVTLRYAVSDAQRMAQVLIELGGFSRRNLIYLRDPSRQEFIQAFEQISRRIRDFRGEGRKEFLIYYSGHSNERGVCLGEEDLLYTELRQMVGDIPADIKISVLDSCASGSLILTKGGQRVAPFLYDESSQMEGQVILASSAANEESQESDTIRASFFTYYLANGLRGAADVNRDGLVTLNEAYSFSHDQTVRRSSRTIVGSQHPVFDIRLVGTGELVLTDLRNATSRITLAEDVEGRVFISKTDGQMVMETDKELDKESVLALEPGTYEIKVERGDQTFVTRFELSDFGEMKVDQTKLQPLKKEQAQSRGDLPMDQVEQAYSDFRRLAEPDESYDFFPVKISFVPNLDFPTESRGSYQTHFNLNVIGGLGSRLKGFSVSGIFETMKEDVLGGQVAGIFARAEGHVLGMQIAGIVTSVTGHLVGYQAGFINVVGLHMIGLQTGFVNQIGSDTLRMHQKYPNMGFQFGFINTIALNGLDGAQFGFINTLEGPLNGAQFGFANTVKGMIRGMQVGFINTAGDLDGAQIGFLNHADHVRGVQIGLVNSSESIKGIPIGLINIIRGGEFKLAAISFNINKDVISTFGYKFVSHYFYTHMAVGTHHYDELTTFGVGIGFGLHIPISDRFHLELGPTFYKNVVDTSYISTTDFNLLYHAQAGWKWGKRFGVVVGGGVQHNVSMHLYSEYQFNWKDNTYLERPHQPSTNIAELLSPMFYAGIEITLSLPDEETKPLVEDRTKPDDGATIESDGEEPASSETPLLEESLPSESPSLRDKAEDAIEDL